MLDSPHESTNDSSALPTSDTQLVAHQEEVPQLHSHPDVMIPPAVMSDDELVLTLQELEGMAMANNPTLVQANAQLQAEQGAAFQAGLWFNPVIGYTGEQIGVDGTAGETQGGFVAQEIVTGGKLRLSREKWAQRARIAATNSCAQQQRVLNDVRTQFFRTLAAQRVVEIHRKLVANGEDNVETHREMLNLGQTTASAVLQAEVELRRDKLNLKDAENDLNQAWRTLVALIGCPQITLTKLDDVLASTHEPLDYDSALGQLLSSSPELTAASQKIQHDQIQLERERVQPIPNVLVTAGVGKNFEAGGQTTAGVNVGLPIPLFDRNQGTIQQAQADLTRSHAEARRLELELQTRLATEYRMYLSAWQRVEEYQATMLPKAEESTKLLRESYQERRAPWVDVLASQRLELTLETEYVESLKAYHESDIAIRGMLLSGGLTEVPPPLGGGHIDATPKPR
jgi:cobalt-zinc-cadmium efflux system outer membrane protein